MFPWKPKVLLAEKFTSVPSLLERFREPTTVCSISQFLLQMNLGALLTVSLTHTSFEKAVGTNYS